MEDCNEPGFCHWTDLSGRLMRVNEQLFVWKSVIQPNSLIAINYSYQTKDLLPQTKAMINLHLFKDPQTKCRCNLQVKENCRLSESYTAPFWQHSEWRRSPESSMIYSIITICNVVYY